MKRLLILSALCPSLFALASCQSTASNERIGQLVSLAITAAERRGVISPEDAADIRAAKTIILPPPSTIQVASGK